LDKNVRKLPTVNPQSKIKKLRSKSSIIAKDGKQMIDKKKIFGEEKKTPNPFAGFQQEISK
jgi:hypothetical protein